MNMQKTLRAAGASLGVTVLGSWAMAQTAEPAAAPEPSPQSAATAPAAPEPVVRTVAAAPQAAPVAVKPPEIIVQRVGGPPSLQQVSLYAVEAPEPRQYRENDLITIIISERASLDRTHKNESEKSYSVSGNVVSFPDMMKLLELRLQNGDRQNLASLDVDYDNEYEGEGKYKREDKLTARVTSRIVEVKPNGTLLLESKTVVRSDNEEQVITLSGICRPEDISQTNTVQSSQLFGLDLNIQNSGDVKKTATKGVIPRVLDTLFNF